MVRIPLLLTTPVTHTACLARVVLCACIVACGVVHWVGLRIEHRHYPHIFGAVLVLHYPSTSRNSRTYILHAFAACALAECTRGAASRHGHHAGRGEVTSLAHIGCPMQKQDVLFCVRTPDLSRPLMPLVHGPLGPRAEGLNNLPAPLSTCTHACSSCDRGRLLSQ